MVCGLPAAVRAEVVHVACPVVESMLVFASVQVMVVLPSLKTTLPVGTVPLGGVGEVWELSKATCAVKVTACPSFEVGRLESTAVVVGKRLIWVTVGSLVPATVGSSVRTD